MRHGFSACKPSTGISAQAGWSAERVWSWSLWFSGGIRALSSQLGACPTDCWHLQVVEELSSK